MDFNIINKVEEEFSSFTKIASKDSVNKANELIVNLSSGKKVDNEYIVSTIQSLLNEITDRKKMSKIASFIEELDKNAQIDECEFSEKVAELSSMDDLEFNIEKRAFGMSFNKPNSNLFLKTSANKKSSYGRTRDLGEYLNLT